MINASLDEIVESNNDYWVTQIVKITNLLCSRFLRRSNGSRVISDQYYPCFVMVYRCS